MRRHILLVDDDESLRQSLAEQLEMYDEFAVTQAPRASAAIDLVKAQVFDAVILDVGLPDMDGRDTCRLIRKAGFKNPIIMLTGQATDADQILGLDAGANDYIAKPFRVNVLLARLRAQLRQMQQSDEAQISLGGFYFQPSSRTLSVKDGGDKIRLTEKEAGILKYLHRAQGMLVPREALLSDVWGYDSEATTHTLETHIYRLRQKLEKVEVGKNLILTDQGGYRLNMGQA
ncbi:MAG: response regulator transcription factor [Dongiaceae bacterium]